MLRNLDTIKKRFIIRSGRWLFDLEALTSKQLEFKPNANAWGLAELYDHVMRVGRSYQLYNFNESLTNPEPKKPKNLFGYVVFDLNVLPKRQIKMENFPDAIVKQFTPELRSKNDLIKDFMAFIVEVERAFDRLETSKSNKHYHDFFGAISSLEWLALVEIHLRHHERQKKRLYMALEKLGV